MRRIHQILRTPEAIGGAIGLGMGLATAAALLLAGDPWYLRSEEARHWIVYWLDFPAGNVIAPVSEWRWDEGMMPRFLLLSTTLNGLFWGAAGTALARRLSRPGRLRRRVLWGAAVELPLLVLLAVMGIPSPFGGGGPLAYAATYVHAPGIALLTWLGLCCGYESHLVISDVWMGPVQHPTNVGLFFLAASNLVMFVGMAYAGRALWRWRTRGPERTGDAAPVAPG